jgi:hypothetical protein
MTKCPRLSRPRAKAESVKGSAGSETYGGKERIMQPLIQLPIQLSAQIRTERLPGRESGA